MKIEKAHLQTILDDSGELIAVLFFNKNREHVFYMANKANEEDVVGLYEKKDLKI